jgi:CheY-like chemotaxis protein
MRVLYIDDDRINTLLFVETCRFVGGVDVDTAGSGAEALDAIQRFKPDLLVIDLHLPDTIGYDLLPLLRARIGQPTLPALLCTADEAELVELPATEAGFDGCWTKPVDLQMVLSELNRRSGTLGGRS